MWVLDKKSASTYFVDVMKYTYTHTYMHPVTVVTCVKTIVVRFL